MREVITVNAGEDRDAVMVAMRAALDEALRRNGVVCVTIGPPPRPDRDHLGEKAHVALMEQAIKENPSMNASRFAEAIGVGASLVSRIRGATKIISADVAKKIVDARASGAIQLEEETCVQFARIAGRTT